jgi:hypothetical protein
MGRHGDGEAIMSYFGKDDPRLEDIRRRGQDAARDEDWASLRAMESELRADSTFWTGIWAPISSYAAWKCGEANPRVLLEEAIADGYEGSGDFDHLLTIEPLASMPAIAVAGAIAPTLERYLRGPLGLEQRSDSASTS